MSDGSGQEAGGGCAALIAAVLLIGAIVAGLVSLAAVVDPFAWMPSAGELWEDCQDDYRTDRDECAWESRFPGVWVHAIVNLGYVGAAVGLLGWVAVAAGELREARVGRAWGAFRARRRSSDTRTPGQRSRLRRSGPGSSLDCDSCGHPLTSVFVIYSKLKPSDR